MFTFVGDANGVTVRTYNAVMYAKMTIITIPLVLVCVGVVNILSIDCKTYMLKFIVSEASILASTSKW